MRKFLSLVFSCFPFFFIPKVICVKPDLCFSGVYLRVSDPVFDLWDGFAGQVMVPWSAQLRSLSAFRGDLGSVARDHL